jgi:hypothetical protein
MRAVVGTEKMDQRVRREEGTSVTCHMLSDGGEASVSQLLPRVSVSLALTTRGMLSGFPEI